MSSELVRVPKRMKEFRKWVTDVTLSSELQFGKRAKRIRTSKTRRVSRRRRKKHGKKQD